jgi:hypothetical protein
MSLSPTVSLFCIVAAPERRFRLSGEPWEVETFTNFHCDYR